MEKEILKGMDISFWDEIVSEGGAYYEDGAEKDLLAILQDCGVNSIRLRLWNEPEAGYANLEGTPLVAKKTAYPWTLTPEDGLAFIMRRRRSCTRAARRRWKGRSAICRIS